MALLDRVTTLVKANLNDLLDKAENPEKLLKQLLLDMQNQFIQVKTQLAIAIADQHLLQKRQRESLESQQEWVRKAELALQKGQEDLARAGLDRSLTYETAAQNFAQQVEDQSLQVQSLKEALHRLEQKIAETQARTELILAQHRRTRVALRAGAGTVAGTDRDAAFERMKQRISEAEALAHGTRVAFEPGMDERLATLEKNDKVDRLLAELKARSGVTG